MYRLYLIGFFLISYPVVAQQQENIAYVNLSGAIGNRQGSVSLDYYFNWTLLKSSKLELGLGGRFTSWFGSSKYFASAPASLANDDERTDSLLLQSPQVNTLNLAINIGYSFVPKLGIGFNIDVVGISFGTKQNGFYLNGNQGQITTAKPTSFNLLLVGNNDRGSLNSQFYIRYFLNDKIAIQAAWQYLFIEYTTESEIQQQPEPNDRFRNKAGMVSIGLTRQF